MPEQTNPVAVTHAARDLGFHQGMISRGALDVVEQLQAAGYDGYLVGGCVRDLLLGVRPKDFDVATNATPEQVKQLLRRSRIIGRRFKIVHVRYGREIIEVSTYRALLAEPKKARIDHSAQGKRAASIADDNEYGSLEEDVLRRDFTVNSLYYDPKQEIVL